MNELKRVDDPDMQPEVWAVEDFISLRGDAPRADRGTEVITGLLRAGEVLLIGSSSKQGKSWLVGNLIWAAISGVMWLGYLVKKGKVLLIDNELKRREIDWRHSQIAHHMQCTPEPDNFHVICRRGQSCDIHSIHYQLKQLSVDWSEYSLIVIDALYKCIPDGASENDNSAMGQLMNTLQAIAEFTDVPVIGVHHSTKGQQGDKAVLDVFAGAGSFGRALDSAVIIRDHEQPEMSVVEFKTRTFPPQPAISAKFEWPLWTSVNTPADVKRTGRSDKEQQAKEDRAATETLLKLIPESKPIQQNRLFEQAGYGIPRCSRLVGGLIRDGKVLLKRKKKKGGKRSYVYYQRQSDSGSDSGSDSRTT